LRDITEQTLTLLLAGGVGSRLHPLTEHRAKPAVPFGGKYRIIDFTLSNCLRSSLRRILVMTQYKSHSLQKHLRDGWSIFNPSLGEYITPVPPQMRDGERWYAGTADAVHQNRFLIERMRRTIPGVAIRTSFIVGFPGETDQDFEELCQFVEAAQFDHAGVFSYSDDETSESFHLDGKVGRGTIYNRRRKLMALQKKISRRRNRTLVGRRFPILVIGPSPETELLWEGRLPGQAEEIDGKTYITEFADGVPQPGDYGEIRITKASDYDLFGVLERVDPAPIAVPPRKQTPDPVQLPVLQ
jgi:hypothetical protein